MNCPYSIGKGDKPYKCSLLNDYCLFQRYCINDRIYKFTDVASQCRAAQKKKSENKGQS